MRRVSDLHVGERVYVHHRYTSRTGQFAGWSCGDLMVDVSDGRLFLKPTLIDFNITDVDGVEVLPDPPD